MNRSIIADRMAARFAMENELGMDPMTMKVAGYFDGHGNPSDSDFHTWCEDEDLDPHMAEAAAYRLATMACEFIFSGRAEEKDVSDEDVDSDELSMGIVVEMEHTSSVAMSKRIALDHLAEISDYYTRLKNMEEEAGVKD